MIERAKSPNEVPSPAVVRAGEDLFDERMGLGISTIHIKLSQQDGSLLVIENTFTGRGGPPRHLHPDQDEWFFVVQGSFEFEVGQERARLEPGDSLLGPRAVPHVWASVGDSGGKILIAFTPAGRMEAFFREVMKANAMPPQERELWRSYGMELLGPPLLTRSSA